jgi:hypothetical protein
MRWLKNSERKQVLTPFFAPDRDVKPLVVTPSRFKTWRAETLKRKPTAASAVVSGDWLANQPPLGGAMTQETRMATFLANQWLARLVS